MIQPTEILPKLGKIFSWCTSVLFAQFGQKIHSISRKPLFYGVSQEVVSASQQGKWVSLTPCHLEKEQNHKKPFYFFWLTLMEGIGHYAEAVPAEQFRQIIPSGGFHARIGQSFRRMKNMDDVFAYENSIAVSPTLVKMFRPEAAIFLGKR